jgi:hypothetical protein
MTEDDRNGFMGRIAALCEIHGKIPTEVLLDAYWGSLRDLTIAEFARAVDRAIGEIKFFPKPSELRDFAGRGSAQKLLNAAAAWEVVHAAMVKYDYTHSVDFGPLTNAVVRNLGGWLWLCGRSLNDLTFDRKKFEEMHQALAGTPISAERSAPLPGQFGGKPILFQIPGEPERRLALPETESAGLALVRDLADAKSAPKPKALCKKHLYGEGYDDCSERCPQWGAAPSWPPPRPPLPEAETEAERQAREWSDKKAGA